MIIAQKLIELIDKKAQFYKVCVKHTTPCGYNSKNMQLTMWC